MIFCLAEAIREADRQFLKNAVSIAITQDTRRANLLTRYNACDGALDTSRGIFGQLKLVNLGASDLRDATLTLLHPF